MAERLDRTPDAKHRRQRVAELCGSLPEAEVEPAGAQHLAFKVNKKIFGYYCCDHHGRRRDWGVVQGAPRRAGSLGGRATGRLLRARVRWAEGVGWNPAGHCAC